MTLNMIGIFAGGIGLFLLGMRLMTDGLKLAAGHTLRDILARSTGTRLRGLFSGFLITAIVQASAVVTIAAIGFVNAGLMSLGQAIAVIYGTNIGTTVTGWLVAIVGFDINIKALALPLVGAGMFLRLIRGERPSGHLGETLAGFGLFFIGLDFLKGAFADLGTSIHFELMVGQSIFHLPLFVVIGFILTFLMQSSSAAMAIVLTSVGSGLIPLNTAAAMIIGANVGTTLTAALAVLGATTNAKRVAVAHILFNLITGALALAALPAIFWVINQFTFHTGMAQTPTTQLALFHTLVKIFGVIILWPFTGQLVGFLEKRFKGAEEDEARPRYLDNTVLGAPVMAMHALTMEVARVGKIARRMAKGAISSEGPPDPKLKTDQGIIDRLVEAAGNFSNLMQQSNLPAQLSEVLPNALRVARYYTETAELAVAVGKAQSSGNNIEAEPLAEEIHDFKKRVVHFLDTTNVKAKDFDLAKCSSKLEQLEDQYQQLKAQLLRAGTEGKVSVRRMVAQLDTLSNIRRIAEQMEKGARYLANLKNYTTEQENGEEE